MGVLTLEGIHKEFPGGAVAVDGVDLDVAPGELVVLLGPSGCGKSTLMRIVAGIEVPTSGRVRIDGVDVTDLPPQKRDVAMVFQNYALYPHMSVRDNLAFGLRMRGTERDAAALRVTEVADSLGITTLLERKPAQLSGGQRQRVALGRAIARRAKVFLLDEPLSNLDVQLRVTTRAELARLHRRLQVPMLYVTHDQEEAMTLGDRVAVMQAGRFLQVAPPLEIYARPATLFVAGFVGSPRMNFVDCSFDPIARRLDLQGTAIALGSGEVAAAPTDRRDVVAGIRPEDTSLVEPAAGDLRGRVDVVEPLGRETLLHVVIDGREREDAEMRVLVSGGAAPRAGATVGLRFRRDRIHLFDAATEQRLEASAPTSPRTA